MSEKSLDLTPRVPEINTKAMNTFAGIAMQLLVMFGSIQQAEAAVPPSFSAEELEKYKKEGNRDPLVKALEALETMRSNLEAKIKSMEDALVSMRSSFKELDEIAKQAKDMPDTLKKIEELRERMRQGIANSEKILGDAKQRVENAKKNLKNIERILKEIDDTRRLREQEKK